MTLEKAIEIILNANGGRKPALVIEYVEATEVVLNAMRNQITTNQMVRWCIEQGVSVDEVEL